MFLQRKLHNLHHKLQRRDAAVTTLETQLDAQQQQAEVEVHGQAHVQLSEQIHAEQVLAPAAQQWDIWSAFMTDRGKVDALNTDMQMNGVEYNVPTDLLPILHSILQVMYSVSDPSSADEKTLRHARVILAQVGSAHRGAGEVKAGGQDAPYTAGAGPSVRLPAMLRNVSRHARRRLETYCCRFRSAWPFAV
jgi:hypothetical protein